MPRHYERKTARQSWSEESMAGAIREVLDATMGYMRAAKAYNVPQSTLEDKVRKARKESLSPNTAAIKKLGRFTTVFTSDQEKELVNHVLFLEERLFGLTLTDVRILAFDLAEANKITHPFNKEKKKTGKDWLYSFLDRHPCLSLRNPEKTSLARAKGFNRTAVQAFYDLYEALLEKHKFSANNIYNVDETGITTVPNKPSKVLALRGKKQVGTLASAEKGTLVTVETCMNAVGNYMPPMFVFPRKKANPLLMDDAPPGSFAAYHESGWITKDIFLSWFEKFIEFSNPLPDKPVLLLLDGHASHTKNIQVINLAREKNVVILCFPPHCTHRLQPLDVSFMAPLSTYYEQEVRKWLTAHPGRPVTIYQVAKLFGTAFTKAAVMGTAISGFKNTGIFPFDRQAIPDHLFAPAEVTERPLTESVQPQDISLRTGATLSADSMDVLSTSQPLDVDVVNNVPSQTEDDPGSPGPCCTSKGFGATPSTSNIDDAVPSSSQNNTNTPVTAFAISPIMIRPAPKKKERHTATSNRRRGKTAILTSSPYKQQLEGEDRDKQTTTRKRKRLEKPQQKTRTKPKNTRVVDNDSSSEEESDSVVACVFCNSLFSESAAGEGWIQCSMCHKWAHEECSGHEEEDNFVCDFCFM